MTQIKPNDDEALKRIKQRAKDDPPLNQPDVDGDPADEQDKTTDSEPADEQDEQDETTDSEPADDEPADDEPAEAQPVEVSPAPAIRKPARKNSDMKHASVVAARKKGKRPLTKREQSAVDWLLRR